MHLQIMLREIQEWPSKTLTFPQLKQHLEVHHFYSNAYNKICRTVPLRSILNSRCLLWSGVRSPV